MSMTLKAGTILILLKLSIQIQKQGMITYTDFCFLTNILATPHRYLDIAFLAFDITGDGEIEAKVRNHIIIFTI